jgi:uncharacterized protein YbaP (TraB family)
MLRRDFNWVLGSLAVGALAHGSYATGVDNPDRGPLFWLVTRAKARVFLLGVGDAKDKAWFTPGIQRAFGVSSQLWLEVGNLPTPEAEDVIMELEHESGRTFFDVLQPPVRARISTYLETLDIKKESVETLRPWKAYYVINSAFWSHRKLPYQEVYPEEVLKEAAKIQGKSVRYEKTTRLDIVRFMAGMPESAQSEYVSWLLDFIDDQNSGANDRPFEWYVGEPNASTRNLDRMRAKYPELYKVMQIERNGWWARKINELLATGGTYFVGIGMLHVLGPDGIPRQLQRMKLVAPSDLHENPGFEMLG